MTVKTEVRLRRARSGPLLTARKAPQQRAWLTADCAMQTIAAMIVSVRTMPAGIRLFLAYALVILAGIGLAMPWAIDQATGMAPVSMPGLVFMALLAFTIFTTTLVLQRKQAAHILAIALSSLTLPAIPLAWLSLAGLASRWPVTLFLVLLAAALFAGLSRPVVRAYLSEP